MATTKKTHTTKKTTVTKKQAAKATRKAPEKAANLTWRFYVVTIGIFLVAVTTAIVAAYLVANVVTQQNTQARRTRIENIYTSLNIGENYRLNDSTIFGDKREYSNDRTRTRASEVTYTRGNSVSNTVADLDAKIKAAGFTFIEEPHPDAKEVKYYYKSSNDEYIHLTVKSKLYWDALLSASAMNQEVPEAVRTMDTNTGPALVSIKVNLDDNNE